MHEACNVCKSRCFFSNTYYYVTFSVKYTFGLLACSVKQCYILTFDCLSSEELFKTIDNRDCSSLTKNHGYIEVLGTSEFISFYA